MVDNLSIGNQLPEKRSRGVQNSLQTMSLSYSNAKSTIKVPLTFNKVEKSKRESFDFVRLYGRETSSMA